MVAAGIIWYVISWGTIDSMGGVLAAALCTVVVGTVLVVKVPHNAVGALALLAGSAEVIYLFGNAYAAASLRGGAEWPAAYLLGWAGSWTGALFVVGVSALILVFPTGRPHGRWKFLLLAPMAATISCLIGAIGLWGLPLEVLTSQELIDGPPAYAWIDAAFVAGFVAMIPATMSVVARFRRADYVERQQIKWLLAATSLFVFIYVGAAMTDDSNQAGWWLLSIAMAAIPLSILFAVLRYRLYEIDRIVSRTVTYSALVVVLAGVFFGAVTLLTSVLESDSDLVTAAATLLVAGLFNPVRKKLHSWVDRRFNRSRYNAQLVMERFSESLRSVMDPGAVVEGWLGVVSDTMQPVAASVWVRGSSS
jgi:hypothetical protein